MRRLEPRCFVIALVLSIVLILAPNRIASAELVVELTGTLDLNSGLDPPGLDGALLNLTLIFPPGATWSEVSTGGLWVATSEHSLTLSGASDDSFNIPAQDLSGAEYHWCTGPPGCAGAFASGSSHSSNSLRFLYGEPRRIGLSAYWVEPPVLPADGQTLIADHFSPINLLHEPQLVYFPEGGETWNKPFSLYRLIDQVLTVSSGVQVQPQSWGRLKSLYR